MDNSITLRGILYFIPESSFQTNPESSFSPMLFENSPDFHFCHPSELSDTPCHSKISINEIPACFLKKNKNELEIEKLKILSDCVRYLFSDGLALSCQEIFFHPYNKIVPLDLFPTEKMSDLKIFSNHSPLKIHPLIDFEDSFKKAEISLIQSFIRASRYLNLEDTNNKKSIHFWIVLTLNETEKKSIKIKRIQCSDHSKSSWNIKNLSEPNNLEGQLEIKFTTIPFFEKGIVFKNVEIEPTQKILLFNSDFERFKVIERNFLDIQKIENGKFIMQGHSQISSFLKRLKKLSKEKNIEFLSEKLDLKPITQLSEEIQIRILSGGKFQFVRKIKTEFKDIFLILNFSDFFKFIQKGFTEGFNGIFPIQETQSEAESKKIKKRSKEMKIHKHCGFFHFFVLKSFEFILERKSLSKSEILTDGKIFLNDISVKLTQFLTELEKKSGFVQPQKALSLKDLCPSYTIEAIHSVFFEIINQAFEEEQFFIPEHILSLEKSNLYFIEIIFLLLNKIESKTGRHLFFKPKFCLFSEETSHLKELKIIQAENSDLLVPIDQTHLSTYSTNPWIQSELLSVLLKFKKENTTFFYENYPLQEIESGDFKPYFEVLDSPTSNSRQESDGSKINWFELHPQFFFKGNELNSKQIQLLAKEGLFEFQGKMFLLPEIQTGALKKIEQFWSEIQSENQNSSHSKNGKSFYFLEKNKTLEMLALRAMGVEIKGGERWNQICQFYDQLSEKKTFSEQLPSLQATLKPYQKQGLQWVFSLYSLGLGGILADDMGLGKTIQTLGFLEYLRTQNKMGKTIILVPTSLTYNWLNESSQFTPDLPIEIFQSKNKDQVQKKLEQNTHFAIICTYGLLSENLEFFNKHNWNICIFDEAQNLKNIFSKRTFSCRQLKCNFKLCLTGTPLENHLGEFFSLIDLVVPGSLGSLESFKEQFLSHSSLNPEDLKYLKLKSKPLVLRRSKAQILSELPPKIETTIRLPFEKKQERIYRDIALSWNQKVKESLFQKGETQSQILMLTALLRLRQVCSDPSSIPQITYPEDPPKISVLIEALQEITETGESALVFTQFLSTLERIQNKLKNLNIPFYCIHGKHSRVEREKNLKAFQENKQGAVLLMTLKTGGVGLNLVKASYVFHLEPWWNPAVENQATDRAHRMGQKKPVQVYRYLMKESIEEKIEILKKRKAARFDALFGTQEDSGNFSISSEQLLSKEDFDYLLSFEGT